MPTPLAPNSPAPLVPRAAKPGEPSPARPKPSPPPIYPQGPSAIEDSVQERARPEFVPAGIELDRLISPLGVVDEDAVENRSSALASFVVFPRLDLETRYESNLFRTRNETADRVLVVTPGVDIKSDWSSHSLALTVDSAIGRHARNTAEDYEDVTARLAGTAELLDSIKISGAVEAARLHQQRGEIFDPNAADGVTLFRRNTVDVGIEYSFDPLVLKARYEARGYVFDSTPTTDNGDFDRIEDTATFRASWQLDEGSWIFVQPAYNRRRYDRVIDSAGFRQDSDGFEILGGLLWDASSVTYAELAVGYIRQEFDEPSFSTIQGPSYSAKIVWNATDVLTLTLNGSRTIQETASSEFSGVLSSAVDFSIDYEFLYNTIVTLRAGYSDEDYDGSDRRDRRRTFGGRIRHMFNEYLYAQLDGSSVRLDSTRDASEFDSYTIGFRLGARI